MLALVLVYVNKRTRSSAKVAPAPYDVEALDTLDTSRYRSEAAIDTTIDF
jgi:hypothetical protein